MVMNKIYIVRHGETDFLSFFSNNCSSVELSVWAFNENAIKFYEGMGMGVKTMILEKILNKH